MELYIDPVQVQTIDTITRIVLVPRNIDFFTSIQIAVYYYKDTGELVQSHPDLPPNITIDKEEYQNWGSDDQYIVNQIINKLGVTVIPAPLPQPPATDPTLPSSTTV